MAVRTTINSSAPNLFSSSLPVSLPEESKLGIVSLCNSFIDSLATTPDVIYLRTKRRYKKRAVRATADTTKKRTRKRTSQFAHVPTSFNHLPAEIRLMIWEEFVRTPRIIRIDMANKPTQADLGYTCIFESVTSYPTKSEQVCPLLGVCHESRYVALKEPFIHFRVEYSALQRKRFSVDNYIRRNLSIRSHDIVFFYNSESLLLQYMYKRGNTASIANIMIDLDVSRVDYKNLEAVPCWKEMFSLGNRLVRDLGNKECLKSIYCLFRDSTDLTLDEPHQYDLDNIQELTRKRLSQFPKYRENLRKWLQEYAIFPRTLNGYTVWSSEDLTLVRNVWKNISVVG
ncbi:hypothetical protein GGR58DRAFT_524586 [Xylaria digitata]|nr:hypothetical protein GGR58DRAFT_524586 [Xylaria digitata]